LTCIALFCALGVTNELPPPRSEFYLCALAQDSPEVDTGGDRPWVTG
jgi:hypothetical protein